MHRNLRVVPQLIFGRGSVCQLGDILAARNHNQQSPALFLIDLVHDGKAFVKALPVAAKDIAIYLAEEDDPRTGA
jgi:3-deoxy-alpha-D-manno-octulosonate 8-oxidase